MRFLFKNDKIKQRNKRKLCRVGLPAALQLCPPGSWLAASHSHVGCGSFCLPQLCSGEDEEVLGQAFTHLLGFHPHSHCISTLVVALLPLPLWHCPLAVLDTLCCLRGCCCSPPALCLCILRRLAAQAGLFLWVYFFRCSWPCCWCWPLLHDPTVWGCGWDCSSGAFTSHIPDLHPGRNDHGTLSLQEGWGSAEV